MDSRDALRLRELQSMADELAMMDAGARQFVAQVFDYLHRLNERVDELEAEAGELRSRVFLDGDHRRRLETMIDSQTSALHDAQACVGRVRALVDLARWSGQSTGDTRAPVVHLDDVQRALTTQS